MSYTKGDWWSCCKKTTPHYIFCGDEIVICAMIKKQEFMEDLSDKELQANAKLIAAAPDLLESIKSLYDAGYWTLLHVDEKEQIELWDKAKQAIKKATE